MTEASRLNPRKNAKNTGVLAAGSVRGRNGSTSAKPSQPAALAQAAASVMLLAGKRWASAGVRKICRKLARNGSDAIRPYEASGSRNVSVSNAATMKFPGSQR